MKVGPALEFLHFFRFRFPQSALSLSLGTEPTVPSPFSCFFIYTSSQRTHSTAQSQGWINEKQT